jgi:hypothetical protein
MKQFRYNGCTVQIQSEVVLHQYMFKWRSDKEAKKPIKLFAGSLSEAERIAGPGYVLLMIHV